MPIRLRLDFVGDGTAIDDRGSVRVATTSRLILYLLHIEAVFIADLFVQRGGRGPITRVLQHLLVGLFATCRWLLIAARSASLRVL